jgi:sugar phosphate isomerase/epimerase
MKIAIIPTTGGADPYKGMEFAQKLGVEGVHIGAYGGGLDLINKSSAERKEILKRIKGYGLEVSALIGWGGEVDLGEEEGLAKNIEWGKKLNEAAVDMSNGIHMGHCGIMPDEKSDPKWKRFVDSLSEIAEHGKSIGATICLETGPEPPRVVKMVMDEINCPGLAVNFDPANLLIWPPHIAKKKGKPFDYDAAMADFDPVEGLKTLIPYVKHVHGKDSVMRRDGTADEVQLGTGMTNWPELYKILVANNYQGFVAIERECGEDAMGDVAKAVEFLRSLE